MSTLPDISRDLVKTYQDEVLKSSSPSTARRKSISLNRFFSWAQGSGKINQNPLQPDSSTVVTTIKGRGRKIGFKVWAGIGLTGALIILTFVLVSKTMFPTPPKVNLAKELPAQTTNDDQGATQSPLSTSPIPASNAVIAGWNLYAKLKLTDQNGDPQVATQSMTFKIYDSADGGDALYTSTPQTVTTDADGSALISLDNVPANLFFQNNQLFVEPEIGTESGILRIPVQTANTSTNLNGFTTGDPETGGGPQTIPVISADGSLVLASQSAAIKANEGNLLVQGQAVTIKAADGSNGNIVFNPDGTGTANFIFEGSQGNFLSAQASNLTSGSLYYGMAPNNATGYNLLKLESGSPSLTTRFSVDALGNTYASGNLNLGGSLTSNDTVLNGRLQLGRFTTNPSSLGAGTLIYNTSDSQLYLNNGTAWNSLGADTLASVTGRGAETDTQLSLNGGLISMGNVGIGTAAPGNKLEVSDSSISTASAMIRNTSGISGTTGLAIQMDAATIDDTTRFINFMDANGNIVGKIQGSSATTVAYTGNGTDMAEYFVKDDPSATFTAGTVMCQGPNGVLACSAASSDKIVGVVSDSPVFLGGVKGPNKVIIALTGQVPALVSPSSADIKPGDLVTVTDNGQVVKATQAGFVIGRAQNTWQSGTGGNTIRIIIANIWANPNLAITNTNPDTGLFANIAAAVQKLTANNVAVKLISPLPDSTDVTVQVGSEATPSGKFAIQNSAGTEVASVDNQGNATFAGVVHSQNIDQIQKLLTQVATDQSVLLAATSSANLTATGSAQLDQLIASDLYVTNQAAINSLSVTNNLAVGPDFVISQPEGTGELGTSLNTLSGPLKLQSLALAPVEIMNGLVSIDTHGNVHIAGDLNVAGRVHSSGLTLQSGQPDSTASAQLLSLQDQNGAQVAGVDASGSANFNSIAASQLVVAAPDATSAGNIVNGVITTNSTVGQAVVPANVSEITIKDPKVTDYTLIYVTPTSATNNHVLYVKSKQNGQFAVGFDQPLPIDASLNWWIVQTSQ